MSGTSGLPAAFGRYRPLEELVAAGKFRKSKTVPLFWHLPSRTLFVGNGSPKSMSGNGWAVGDYWQFQSSTLGFSDIGISFDQISSSTGTPSSDVATKKWP